MLDMTTISDLEFRSWLAGTAAFLPKRTEVMSEGQLVEDE